MFAPERPECAPGQKALLLNGGAVPNVMIVPLENGLVRLQVMLNNYDAHGGYSWRHVDLEPEQIGYFFIRYTSDPEFWLKFYFNWQPQPRTRAMVIDNREVREAQDYVNALL